MINENKQQAQEKHNDFYMMQEDKTKEEEEYLYYQQQDVWEELSQERSMYAEELLLNLFLATALIVSVTNQPGESGAAEEIKF